MFKNFEKILPYKKWFLLASLTGFLTIAGSIGLLMASGYIIAKAALHPFIAELSVAIVGVRFFGIARGLLRYVERLVSHEATFRILASWRTWFYQQIEPLAPEHFKNKKSGDLLARVIGDIEHLEQFYIKAISPPLTAVFITLLMWFLFGIFNWIFPLILTLFFIAGGIGLPLFSHYTSQKTGDKIIKVNSRLSEQTLDVLHGFADLAVFNRAEEYFTKVTEQNRQLVLLKRKMNSITALNDSLLTFLMNGAVFTILYVAIPQVHATLLDGVSLTVLVMGTMAAFEAIAPLPQAAQYLQSSKTAMQRITEITDQKPPVTESLKTLKDISGPVSFESVTFSYHENEPVLNNISLQFPEKGLCAIIGPSGSGKTTLTNLLLHLYKADSGEIKIGENSINSIPRKQLAEKISFASQQTVLFNGTVNDNFKIIMPEATQQEIIKACKAACIHNTIMNLPQGYDTWLGEKGYRLSGGEKQRLVLARAILKNTPVIVFDEPTANLDNKTAETFFKNIELLAKEKAIIVITHQLWLLPSNSEIYVLYNGTIAEQGTRKQLANNKLYSQMYNILKDQIADEIQG